MRITTQQLRQVIREELSKNKLNEDSELKLGVRYVNNQGKEGFIQTGGSKNPKDWVWYDGKIKHPYLKVKKELKPSKNQNKTGFSDYLKGGGRVWDNVNTNGNSVKKLNEANEAQMEKLFTTIKKYNDGGKHTLALIELAKFLKDKKSEKILNQIEIIGKELSSMPKDLQTLRMFQAEIRINLRKEFEKKYGRDAYNKLEDII